MPRLWITQSCSFWMLLSPLSREAWQLPWRMASLSSSNTCSSDTFLPAAQMLVGGKGRKQLQCIWEDFCIGSQYFSLPIPSFSSGHHAAQNRNVLLWTREMHTCQDYFVERKCFHKRPVVCRLAEASHEWTSHSLCLLILHSSRLQSNVKQIQRECKRCWGKSKKEFWQWSSQLFTCTFCLSQAACIRAATSPWEQQKLSPGLYNNDVDASY